MAFISGLMESKVHFVAADRPAATEFELHVYAAVSQEERRKISERTRAALQVKKIQLAREGRKLGNPNARDALKLARAAKQSAAPAPEVLRLMHGWRKQGRPFQAIAAELNKLKIRTGRGSEWYGSTVRAQLAASRGPISGTSGEQTMSPPLGDQRQPMTPSPPTESPQRTVRSIRMEYR